ncbi:MAG: hypothetical protein ACYC4H_05540 [Desulfocucumaceae bacterium]
MYRQLTINLLGVKLGDFTAVEGKAAIEAIGGIELAVLDCKQKNAFIVVNTDINSPDEIIGAVLETGITFERFYWVNKACLL